MNKRDAKRNAYSTAAGIITASVGSGFWATYDDGSDASEEDHDRVVNALEEIARALDKRSEKKTRRGRRTRASLK